MTIDFRTPAFQARPDPSLTAGAETRMGFDPATAERLSQFQGPASPDPSLMAGTQPVGGVGVGFSQPQGPAATTGPSLDIDAIMRATGVEDPALATALFKWQSDPSTLDQNDLTVLTRKPGTGGPVMDRRVAGALVDNSGARAENQAALDAMREKVAGRVEQIGATQEVASAERANQVTQYGEQLVQANAELAKLRATHAEQVSKLTADNDRMASDIVKAAENVDPNRLLRGGRNVVAGLAAALGAFGSALTKTPNTAVQIIESSLDRDFEAQKGVVSAKKEQLSYAQQALAQKRGLFQDETAAKLATKADMYDVMANKLGQIAIRAEGTQQGLSAQNAADAFRAKGLEDRQNALMLEAQQLQARLFRPAGGRGDNRSPLEIMQQVTAAHKAITGEFGDGADGATPQDRALAQKNIAQLGELAASKNELGHLANLNEESNMLSRGLGVGKGLEQNRAASIAAANYTHAISGAAASEPEMQRHLSTINGGITSGQHNVGVKQLQANSVAKAATLFNELAPSQRAAVQPRLTRMGFTEEEARKIVTGSRESGKSTQIRLGYAKPE